MSVVSPIISQGFGPGAAAGISLLGFSSSLASIAAAIANLGGGNLAPIAISGGRSSSSKYERSDRTSNFTIKIGIVQCNKSVWNENKKTSYITQDNGTIVRVSFIDTAVQHNDIFIKADLKSVLR